MSFQPGYYNCRAIPESFQLSSGEIKKDGSRGAPCCAVHLQIFDENDQPIGEPVQTVLYLSPAAAPYSVERLKKLGMTNDDISQPIGLGSEIARVQAKEEESNTGGKTFLRWEVSTLSGGGMSFKETLQVQQKAAFASQFKGLFAGTGAAPAPAKPANTTAFAPKKWA